VSRHLHRDAFRDAGPHEIADRSAPEIVQDTAGTSRLPARSTEGHAKALDRLARSVKDLSAHGALSPLEILGHPTLPFKHDPQLRRNLAADEKWPPLPKDQHDAIYRAWQDLVQRLKTDSDVQNKAQQLLNYFGSSERTVAKFVTYLEQYPHFHDGTKSTLCFQILLADLDSLACRMWPLPWPDFSVQGEMRASGDTAYTWRGRRPLHVFFDPAQIGLAGEGRNIGNEAVIFHEALHGWTGKTDLELRALFNNLPAPSCSITEKIRVEVLFGAPALDSQVAYGSCIPH